MAYPTPPPTSSPKDDLKHDYTTVHNYRTYDTTTSIQRIPAQESYFHAVSAPSSPKHTNIALYQNPNHPEQRLRRSNTDSPKHFYGPPNQQHTDVDHVYDTRPPQPGRVSPPNYNDPMMRPSSAQRRRTPPPRPLYFSPSNPPPSPYSVGRPQPRKGFVTRMKDKLMQWIRGLIRWAKRNPIKAGLASFVPVMLGAGAIRAVSGLSGVTKKLLGKLEMGMGGGRPGQKRKPAEKKNWGWGLDHFVGFGGSKGGPLDGIMKVFQMFLNHYAKLSPSPVPRAGIILLELYFLDKL